MPFTIFNVYVPTDNSKAKLIAAGDLKDAKVTTNFNFAGGDWNIKPDATYTVGGKVSSVKISLALEAALSSHKLVEVKHPSMTRISGHSPPKVSRLDRWYLSHPRDNLDLLDLHPEIWLPPHAHEPGRDAGPPSDHFPLHLSFDAHLPPTSRRRIPLWLAGKPEFAEAVAARWETIGSCPWKDPFEELHAGPGMGHAGGGQHHGENR